MRDRTRAVSVTVNYVLAVAIATVLLTSLLVAAGDAVSGRQEAIARGEAATVTERVVTGLQAADRLATAGGDTVDLELALPDRIAGESYTIAVTSDASGTTVVVRALDGAVSQRTPVVTTTAVSETTLAGGEVRIRLVGGSFEVERA